MLPVGGNGIADPDGMPRWGLVWFILQNAMMGFAFLQFAYERGLL